MKEKNSARLFLVGGLYSGGHDSCFNNPHTQFSGTLYGGGHDSCFNPGFCCTRSRCLLHSSNR